MITRYIQGDVTETELMHIAHGVNCQNTMGSGVAKALFTKWPQVKENYHSYMGSFKERWNKQPREFLGEVQKITIADSKVVWNLFTQENYGYDGERYVNYSAVATALRTLTAYGIKQVAIPKIGCGLAGGNWCFMEQLINDTVGDALEIWVYELEQKTNGRNDFA